MGVLLTSVNFEVFDQSLTQTVFGEHTANGFLDNGFGRFSEVLCGGSETLTAGVASVAYIGFSSQFVTCQAYFLSVDDDYVVTAINVGSKARFVFTAQNLDSAR